jgi:hypothetical protein
MNGQNQEATTNSNATATSAELNTYTPSAITAADRLDEETEKEKHVAKMEVPCKKGPGPWKNVFQRL